MSASPQSVVEIESQYVLQSYARHPLVLVRGDGPWMWDAAGKRYLRALERLRLLLGEGPGGLDAWLP